MSSASARQPAPTGEGRPVVPMVIKDIKNAPRIIFTERWTNEQLYRMLMRVAAELRSRLGPLKDDDVRQSLIADIQERAAFGKKKYGTVLRTENGRNPILDAYQENIDELKYFRQALEEGKL